MTDEEEFEAVVRQRVRKASQVTGYSFAGLLKLIDKSGAFHTAKRLITPTPGNLGRFQKGMRKLFDLACFSGYGTHIRILKQAVIPRELDHRIPI